MSRYFSRAEDARNYGIAMAGVDPTSIEVVEDSSLRVQSAAGLFSNPETPDGLERIQEDLEGQTGYRFKNKDGIDIAIVVAPFRDGYCVWGISPNGMAIRF